MIGPYYSHPGTAEGFAKAKQRGAILPPFAVQDNVSRLVQGELDFLADRMAEELARTRISRVHGYVADELPQWMQSLLKRLVDIIHSIRRPNFKEAMLRNMLAAESSFFTEFLADAPPPVATAVQFGLDASTVFKNTLAGLRQYYFDTAMTRIEDGLSECRKRFIVKIEKWAAGESDLSDLPALIQEIKAENYRFSLYFARDQFARFNKALTLASFDQAGVKRMKWWTVMDGRVRKSHRELHGKVFDMDDLPEALHDFNCRCVLLPVFDEKGK